MNIKKTLSVQKAITYIKIALENGTWKNGDRLPILPDLANRAGVSRNIMWKAITLLQQEKIVKAKRKIGVFVGTTIPAPKPVIHQTRIPKWQTIKENLKKDIFEKNFPNPEKLPSFKELMSYYRTGFSVIKPAIDSLVQDQVLVSDKRGFSITPVHTASPTNTVYCIVGPLLFDKWSRDYEKSWMEAFFHSLEQECAFKKCRLQKIQFSKNIVSELSKKASNILGLLLIYSPDLANTYAEKISAILELKKPISIVNYTGHIDPAILRQSITTKMSVLNEKSPPVFLYEMANQDLPAGFTMGKHLLGKGHTHIGYFAYTYDRDNLVWAQQRLKGLQMAYANAGYSSESVAPFLTPESLEDPSIGTSTSIPELQRYDEELKFIQSISNQIFQKFPGGLSHTKTADNINEFRYHAQLYRDFHPLFLQALTNKNITAWVCANDDTALYAALKFLSINTLPQKASITIAAFDDKIDDSLNNITTYNFNFAGIARHMLNLVLYPGFMKKKKNELPLFIVNIDGMVIDRGSV